MFGVIEWKQVDKKIGTCQYHKYLGKIIPRNGKNEKNIGERFKKVRMAMRAINFGTNRAMRKIEIDLIRLHEAKTWRLNKTTKNELNKPLGVGLEEHGRASNTHC